MQQRERFIIDHLDAPYSMTELCAHYGISRRTGYKWIRRFEDEGRVGLADRSHAPHRTPHKISRRKVALILEAKESHPAWGPVKLLDWLRPRHPNIRHWPAASTVGDLLARNGLVRKRRRRRTVLHPGAVPIRTTAPNGPWTADFKGQFRTRDGIYCYPLTIADQHTRFLIACHGLPSVKTVGVRRVFERVFREYGLPLAVRTDNGVPFASNGLHGLSQLNVWWIRMGIQHQRIRPASPQENGAHERMHKTLKIEALRPAKGNLAAQQRAFSAFRTEFNCERPHAALKGATPGSAYTPSPRPFPRHLPPLEYPLHFKVKRLTNAGTIRFMHKLLFIANALKQNHIGLKK